MHAIKLLTLSTPQGAVLSPFLWNVFLDPLLHSLSQVSLNTQTFAWADDVMISFHFDGFSEQLARASLKNISDVVHKWAINNKATFSEGKSQVMYIKYSHRKPMDLSCQTSIGNIKGVQSLVFLGVTFDTSLTFTEHIKLRAANVLKLLFSLKPVARKSWKVSKNFFHQIYVGAILPKVFYAAPVFITLHKNGYSPLSKVLRQVACFISGCSRDTPTDFLFAAADIPPTDIFLKQQAILRFFNTALQTPPEWGFLLFQFLGRTNLALRDIASNMGISPDIFSLLRPKAQLGPQCYHPADRTPLKVSLKFDNFSKVHPDSILVCTDGSSDGTNFGSGLVLFRGTDLIKPIVIKSFSLPEYATVYSAESVVLLEGLKAAASEHDLQPCSAAHFYLDNQATLLGLAKPWASKNPTIHQIYSLSRSAAFPISFTYVPAHKGHHGNELADIAAKAGLSAPSELSPPMSKSFINRSAKIFIQQIREKRWNSSNHSPWLTTLFPAWSDLDNFLTIANGLPRVVSAASGHYPTNDYLYKRNLSTFPACPNCDWETNESLDHLILHYPKFEVPRSTLLQKLGYTPSSTNNIFHSFDKFQLSALETFLIQVHGIKKQE